MKTRGCVAPAVSGLLLVMLTLMGCSESRVLVVTGTVVGLEASPGDGSTQPPSVTFGYKRAEVAFVPTATEPADKVAKHYPPGQGTDSDAYSTLAAFKLAANWFGPTKIEQVIATGHAARIIQETSNEFTRAFLEGAAGTDELSSKFTHLFAKEKDSDCSKALQAWRATHLTEAADYHFARLQKYEAQRAQAWRDSTVQTQCKGK